jgi:hypothetical protein
VGVGPAVEAPRTDVPRPPLGVAAVGLGAGAAVLVAVGWEVEVVVAEAGLSGFLKRLNGALDVTGGAVEEVGV